MNTLENELLLLSARFPSHLVIFAGPQTRGGGGTSVGVAELKHGHSSFVLRPKINPAGMAYTAPRVDLVSNLFSDWKL